jgi:RHS repeat-associated protein
MDGIAIPHAYQQTGFDPNLFFPEEPDPNDPVNKTGPNLDPVGTSNLQLFKTPYFKGLHKFMGLSGHQRDPNGLVYMHNRYYSPLLGHFLTPDFRAPDIYDPTTFTEPYAYAAGNPFAFWDPDGLHWYMFTDRNSGDRSFIWIGAKNQDDLAILEDLEAFGQVDFIGSTHEEMLSLAGLNPEDVFDISIKYNSANPDDAFAIHDLTYTLPQELCPTCYEDELSTTIPLYEPAGTSGMLMPADQDFGLGMGLVAGSVAKFGLKSAARYAAKKGFNKELARNISRALRESWKENYGKLGYAGSNGANVGQVFWDTASGTLKRLKQRSKKSSTSGGFRGPAARGFDWEHIFSRHSDWGNIAQQRTRAGATIFEGMTKSQIRARVEAAWKNRKLIRRQVDPDGVTRLKFQGIDPTSNQTVEIWFNLTTQTVESAYPIFP